MNKKRREKSVRQELKCRPRDHVIILKIYHSQWFAFANIKQLEFK